MAATFPEPYVVASCHVERPLDDRVWAAFASLQRRRPGGIAVAALIRPPDHDAGEVDEARWLERALAAEALAPLGHHTHWTTPTHARPTGGDPGERVGREGAWLRERGVRPTLFCGGGWYDDLSVAAACASFGYADCTPRPARPGYLAEGEPWVELAAPAWVSLPDGARLAALPTTHTVGDALRSVARRRSSTPRIHVYFHDTDLVDRRRRAVVEAALRLLGARRRRRTLADELGDLDPAHDVAWDALARGSPDVGRG